MKNFRSYDRSQRMLLPPDLKDWVADDDLAHFIVEAAERVDMGAFHISRTGSGKAQYHPRMMLGLLVYCVPIRLSPIPTTSRVLPIPRVKLGLGRAAISPAMSSAS